MKIAEHRFTAPDGTELSYAEMGVGRTVVMIHGFLADRVLNWVEPGIADQVAAAGYRLVMPDLRGHGRSGAPTDLTFWPTDVLVEDQLALIAHLGLTDYDLVGYSLGARTAARMLVRGARPRRAVLGGMGDHGVMHAGDRADMFEDSIRNGDQAKDPRAGRYIQRIMADRGLNPAAMLGVIASFASTSEAELRTVPTPTLVVCGDKDFDNGSATALAALLPKGEARIIPGDHLTAVSADLGQAICDFLERA